jgi:hypothetical protein
MSNYYDGLNQKLLAAIPTDAQRVLELGAPMAAWVNALRS